MEEALTGAANYLDSAHERHEVWYSMTVLWMVTSPFTIGRTQWLTIVSEELRISHRLNDRNSTPFYSNPTAEIITQSVKCLHLCLHRGKLFCEYDFWCKSTWRYRDGRGSVFKRFLANCACVCLMCFCRALQLWCFLFPSYALDPGGRVHLALAWQQTVFIILNDSCTLKQNSVDNPSIT